MVYRYGGPQVFEIAFGQFRNTVVDLRGPLIPNPGRVRAGRNELLSCSKEFDKVFVRRLANETLLELPLHAEYHEEFGRVRTRSHRELATMPLDDCSDAVGLGRVANVYVDRADVSGLHADAVVGNPKPYTKVGCRSGERRPL